MDRGPAVPALRLHVYAPRRPVDQVRPGLLWIHGGGTLAVRCRDLGIGAIGHLVLIAPMVDDRTVPPAGVRRAVWAGAANRLGWDSYLSDGASAELPESYAAVARYRLRGPAANDHCRGHGGHVLCRVG